jgi:hypothetical protein
MFEWGLVDVATDNQAHEVGNALDNQEAIVETPTNLVVGDQAILDTQEVKTRDQKPNCMSETLVVIKTHEAKIKHHEPNVMNDQVIFDTQEVKTIDQEPNVVGVLDMSKLVCTTLVVLDI